MYAGAVVTQVPDTIPIAIGLSRIRNHRTVVEGIRDTITIAVKVEGVLEEDILVGTVAAIIPNAAEAVGHVGIALKIVADVHPEGWPSNSRHRRSRAGIRYHALYPGVATIGREGQPGFDTCVGRITEARVIQNIDIAGVRIDRYLGGPLIEPIAHGISVYSDRRGPVTHQAVRTGHEPDIIVGSARVIGPYHEDHARTRPGGIAYSYGRGGRYIDPGVYDGWPTCNRRDYRAATSEDAETGPRGRRGVNVEIKTVCPRDIHPARRDAHISDGHCSHVGSVGSDLCGTDRSSPNGHRGRKCRIRRRCTGNGVRIGIPYLIAVAPVIHRMPVTVGVTAGTVNVLDPGNVSGAQCRWRVRHPVIDFNRRVIEPIDPRSIGRDEDRGAKTSAASWRQVHMDRPRTDPLAPRLVSGGTH